MANYGTEYLKSRNRKQIFDLFLKQRVLSRAEIVQNTDMSFPTVSKAVDFLLSRGIVQETDDAAKSPDTGTGPGRKRQMLHFNSTAYCALSLNFEGQYLDMGLVDLAGQLLCQSTTPFDTFEDREANRQLAAQMQALLGRAPCPVLGVGIGLPANVDPQTGTILSFENAGIVTPVGLREFFCGMAEQIELPLFVENDVNLACRGESACRGDTGELCNLCYLTLGTGFGAGIMLNGKLWQGAANRAGEIGHMLLQLPGSGSPCMLEEIIGLQAVDRRFGLRLLENPDLTQPQKDEIIDFLLEPMAVALYNVVYLFDLEHFILAGYLPELLGPAFLQRLEAAAGRLLGSQHTIHLSAPRTCSNALIGAASMVFEKTILNELMDR